MDSSNRGGIVVSRLPSGLLTTRSGRWPRKTFVSIGSRKGSMGGFVTWEALSRSLSQYTGISLGLPMEDSNTPPVLACL